MNGRRVHLAAVDAEANLHAGLVRRANGVAPEIRDLMTGEVRALAWRQPKLAVVGIGMAGRERTRDHHAADVHDHAAVGATEKTARALATGRQHQLPHRRSSRERTEPEGD